MGDMSVLMVAREVDCKTSGRSWIITGVVLGIVGVLIIAVGLLFLFRDTAQRWARRGAPEEGTFLI